LATEPQTKSTETAVVKYEPNAPVGSAGTLKALLGRADVLASLGRLVPKHLNPDRLAQIVLLAGSRQPLLFKCTQSSLLQSVLKSAELGVSCSGSLARGYLVPYYNGRLRAYEAQMIIGYGGLIDIICEPGGSVSHVTAELVYSDDEFNVWAGTRNEIHHKQNPTSKRLDADLIGGYLIAWVKGADTAFQRYMPLADILKHREKTASRNKAGEIVGPWVSDFAAMCRKTLVRASAQYLPLSKSQQEKIETGDEQTIDMVPEPMSGSLAPTSGRQSWARREEPAQSAEGFGFDPPPDEEPTGNADADQAPSPSDDVSDSDRQSLLKSLTARLEARGVKTKQRQEEAVAAMCKAVGAEELGGIKSVDQYNAALDWIQAQWGE